MESSSLALLSTATIEYSCLGVCVSLCGVCLSVCVCLGVCRSVYLCVCLSVYAITQKECLKLEHIVVYEKSLDQFDKDIV